MPKKPLKVRKTDVPPSRDVPVNYETVRTPAVLQEIYEYATDGCTISQIAGRLGVHEMTLHTWARKYPEVAEALDNGTAVADDRVEYSLYELCFGRNEKEITLEKDGNGDVVKQVVKSKYVPANVTAIQYWLNNRRRGSWTGRNSVEFTSDSAVPIQFVYDMNADLPPQKRRKSADSGIEDS